MKKTILAPEIFLLSTNCKQWKNRNKVKFMSNSEIEHYFFYSQMYDMNEWMNAWLNEWMNAWLNEWMNECIIEWMNEWVNK